MKDFILELESLPVRALGIIRHVVIGTYEHPKTGAILEASHTWNTCMCCTTPDTIELSAITARHIVIDKLQEQYKLETCYGMPAYDKENELDGK